MRSKQWDKLRQNILRPMQASPSLEAELRHQGCTARVWHARLSHVHS